MQPDTLALFHPYSLGAGIVEKFTIPNPAAGAQFSRTTGSGYVERIRALAFVFTADANAANRIIAIEYRDADTNTFAGSGAGVFQTATSVFRWYWGIGQGLNVVTQSTRQTNSLPDVFLFPGDSLVSLVGAMQAGDQISAIRGYVERFPETPGAFEVGDASDRTPPPPARRARR